MMPLRKRVDILPEGLLCVEDPLPEITPAAMRARSHTLACYQGPELPLCGSASGSLSGLPSPGRPTHNNECPLRSPAILMLLHHPAISNEVHPTFS